MYLTPAQIKGRIKNVAKQNGSDPITLLRIYMMERFLERITYSKYKDDFIVKGGILVTSMIGISMRSTMDIDTTIRNFDLTKEETTRIVNEIKDISLDDHIEFILNDVSDIMDNMEYPGIRIHMDAKLENLIVPIKIDISTGDVITPREIRYEYPLLLEDKSIQLWSYNLETILAEKIQTILSRGLLNTRMRDFYDVTTLFDRYNDQINYNDLLLAFDKTCSKRETLSLLEHYEEILCSISEDSTLQNLWKNYCRKYKYASHIEFSTSLEVIKNDSSKIAVVHKQMMELKSGGAAELTASVDRNYTLPFIGDFRQLISDNSELFNSAPKIKNLIEEFLNNQEETAYYPYIYVRWLDDTKAKQINVKIVFNYYDMKYIQMHNMQSSSRLTKERMEYAIEYLFESGSFSKGERI